MKSEDKKGAKEDMRVVKPQGREILTYRRENESKESLREHRFTKSIRVDELGGLDLEQMTQAMEDASSSPDDGTLTKKIVVTERPERELPTVKTPTTDTPKPKLSRERSSTLKTPRPDFSKLTVTEDDDSDEPIIVLQNPIAYVEVEDSTEENPSLPENAEESQDLPLEEVLSLKEEPEVPRTLDLSPQQSRELHKMMKEYADKSKEKK